MEPKKLYKSRTDVKIDGVCAGVAKFLGVDPTVVRLVWLLIALAGGSGILLYLVCMLIIPREPDVKDYTGGGYGN